MNSRARMCLIGLAAILTFSLSLYHTTMLDGSAFTIGRVLNQSRREGQVYTNMNGSELGCTEEFKKSHFMTIGYEGRTANLVFQFAVLIATAERTCYTAIRKPDTLKHFDGIFELRNVKTIRYAPAAFKTLPEPGWSTYDENLTSRITPEYNWIIDGFRQSFRYFGNYSDLIRSSIRFKETKKKPVTRYLREGPLRDKVRACLHVRRGDLVDLTTNQTLGHLMSDLAYIKRAMRHMSNYLSPANFSFVVVSDDLPWCRLNIRGDNVVYSPFKDVGQDMYLLTQCDHNIITTCSFSWLTAWLNETGLVIYDKLYVTPPTSVSAKGHTHLDYYPSHWVGL